MSYYEPVQGGGSLIVAYQVANKRVLIVGGGNVAAQRIKSALIADARITVVAPAGGLNDEVRHRIEMGQVSCWRDRVFQDSDLDDCDMVLTALDDHDESLRIGQLCRERRIPVNVADVPSMCDFYFMSQHRDGPVQLAVSTNGKGPKLANMIRTAIAQAQPLPSQLGKIAERMGELRAKVREWEPALDKADRRMGWVTRVCEAWGLDGMAQLASWSVPDEAFYDVLYQAFQEDRVPMLEECLKKTKEEKETYGSCTLFLVRCLIISTVYIEFQNNRHGGWHWSVQDPGIRN